MWITLLIEMLQVRVLPGEPTFSIAGEKVLLFFALHVM